jgi:S-adenosylmethionine uptake transporter
MADAPNPRGPSPILVAIAAVALACAMDAMIKHMGASYTALTIALARFGFGAVVMGGVYAIARPPPMAKGAFKIHVLRAVLIVCSALTFFYALAVLPLAEANVLGFAAPLYVPFVAKLLLKEPLSKLSLAATFIGFFGVVIAAWQPSGVALDARHWSGIVSVCVSAPLYAVAVVLLRYRASKDAAVTIGLMGNLLPALILAIPALALAPPPSPKDLPLFMVIGTLGATFWLMLTWAYARAPAQRIAPIDYTSLLWASLWGYLFFQETPRLLVWVGALFIISACLLLAWDERRSMRPTATEIAV